MIYLLRATASAARVALAPGRVAERSVAVPAKINLKFRNFNSPAKIDCHQE